MQRRFMERDYVGSPIAPNPIPDDPTQLLALMDEALAYAGGGVAGSNAFEHGVRLFNQFKASLRCHNGKGNGHSSRGINISNESLENRNVVVSRNNHPARRCRRRQDVARTLNR